MNKTSPEIIQRCLEGDKDALELLVRNVQRRIYNLAVRFLWEPMDAEDATQEILIKVITNLSNFRGDSAFETWAHRIAVNHLLNLKARAIETLTFEEGAVHLERIAGRPEYEGPDQRLLAEEVKISCTTSMLICLSRPLRMAYIVGQILELEGSEAAYVLDITPEAFRKRLSLARMQLRTFMQSHCGIYDPTNPCRCTKKISYDITIGRMNPKSLRFADKGDRQVEPSQVLNTVELLRDDVAIMRSHPLYSTPDRLLSNLKQLIMTRLSTDD
jgi:RNA polymerase sigma factor (sigma-70 family)